jgi:hypothetical protein
VRANALVRHILSDGSASHPYMAAAAMMPIEKILSRGFKSDKLVVQHATNVSAGVEHAGTRAEAFRVNASFVSGKYGKDAVNHYYGMLSDFDSAEHWQNLRLTSLEKGSISPALLCSMVDAWRRCVVPFEDVRFLLMSMCFNDSFVQEWNLERNHRIHTQLNEKLTVCPDCLDEDFTMPCFRLLDGNPRRLWNLLVDLLPLLRINTYCCERSHLPGEETKGPRARGRALTATNLQKDILFASRYPASLWMGSRLYEKVDNGDEKVVPDENIFWKKRSC